MTTPTPIARTLTQCPYCAHVSPADSKFCNECGAALHLMPCPHCGSVNDITLTELCARCGGDLHAQASVDFPVISAEPVPPPPAEPTRPRALAALVVLIAAASTGYYAYQQRAAPAATAAPLLLTPSVAKPAPVPPEPPPAELETPRPPAAAVAVAAPKPAAPKPAPNRNGGNGGKGSAAQPSVAPKAPAIGPCTEAVAALGLCTPEATPRRP